MGRGVAAALAAALTWAPGASAIAQTAAAPQPPVAVATPDAPRSASLSWVRFDGAASCSTATEIAEGVARILRRDALVAPTRAVMAIEARVERIPGKKRFRAIIDISGGDGKVRGTRKLESASDDCRKLDDAAALAIALMIDPNALQPPPPAAPAPPAPTVIVKRDVMIVPVPVLVEPPRAPTPPEPPPRSSPELTLAIGPSLALGLVPGPAPGVRFGVELGPTETLAPGDRVTVGPSSIRVGFASYSGSIDVEGARPGQAGSLSMIALLPQVALCPATVWVGARGALAACVVVDAGALTWTGDDFDSAVRSGARPFVDVGPVAQARLVLVEPFALEIRGAAVVPLIRDTFEYDRGAGTSALAYEPGAIGATFDVALAVGLGL